MIRSAARVGAIALATTISLGLTSISAVEPTVSVSVAIGVAQQRVCEAAPGPAWQDPQAESARQAIGRDLPRFLGLASDTVAALTSVGFSGISSADGLRIGQGWRFDPASVMAPPPRGWTSAVDGSVVRWQTGLSGAAPAAPMDAAAAAVIHWRLDPLLAAVSVANSAITTTQTPAEARMLAPWAGGSGAVDATVTLEPGWRTVARVRLDRPLPLRRLAPSLAVLADRDQALRLAVAIDPQLIATALDQGLPPMARRGWRDATGHSIAEVFERLTGDGYAQVRLDGLVPRGGVILLARPGVELAGIARAIADVFRGRSHPSLVGAYQLDTPIGPLVLAVRGPRFVAGTDEALVRAWLDGAAGTDPLPTDRALVAELDTPALAPLLPLVAMIPMFPELPHAPGAIDRLAGLLGDAALAQVQGGAREFGPLLRGAAVPVERLAGAGQVSLPLADLAALARELQPASVTVAGTAPAIDDLEQRFAWYAVAEPPVKRVALVFRSARGWHVLDDWRRGRASAMNRLAIDSRLKALGCPVAVGGAPIDQLPITALPPMLGDWLPPIPVLAQHLPRWSLAATLVDGGMDLTEDGLPIATTALTATAIWAWHELTPRLAAVGGDGFQ